MKAFKKIIAAFSVLVLISACVGNTGCAGEKGNKTDKTDAGDMTEPFSEAGRPTGEVVRDSEGMYESENDGMKSITYSMSGEYRHVENVRMLGRTYRDDYKMVSDNEVLRQVTFFGWTASGFEIAFTGTELKAELVSNRFDEAKSDKSKAICFYASVDGEDSPDKSLYIALSGTERTSVCLASGLTEGKHVVTLRRASRNCMGSFFDSRTLSGKACLASVTVTGESPALLGKVADRELQLEFIGDSITCGDAISRRSGVVSEDGLRTYAAYAARELGADYNALCISGNGVICSVLGGPLLDLPDQYLYTDSLGNGKEKWDFGEYSPDYVIVNLGTNDSAGVKSRNPGSGFFSYDEFMNGVTRPFKDGDASERHTGVKDFLTMIHENNPQARIIWLYGAMGSSLSKYISQAIDEWNGDAGETIASFVTLPDDGTLKNGKAYDSSHPSESASLKYASLLTEEIRRLEAAADN